MAARKGESAWAVRLSRPAALDFDAIVAWTDDIARGLMTLHVARYGRKGRHFLLFRLGAEQEALCIDVLRILHDGMDLQRHVPEK